MTERNQKKKPDVKLKQGLIDLLVECPLAFNMNDHRLLYKTIESGELPRSIIRQTALRILDLTEDGIFKSSADKGLLGFANKRSRDIRHSRFKRLMSKNFRESSDNIVIVAEGDSWFEHPLVMDILDHLEFHDDIAIYSLAYGSDWLDNIIFQGEYIDQLSILKPDVFLVSGGGNDLIEGGKIGLFLETLHNQCKTRIKISEDEVIRRFPAVAGWTKKEKKALTYLGIEFYGFLNIMIFQYYYLFRSIRKKYPELHIFTQGYDYATPASLIKREWYSWFQRALNWFQGSGGWIETPMRQSKVYDPHLMHDIMKAMLGLFNEALIEITKDSHLKNIYHIDSRGLSGYRDWFDEIHIKSKKYLQIAETYYHAIKEVRKATTENPVNTTVFKSKEIWNKKRRPGFSYFMKGFKRTSPRFSTLVIRFTVFPIILILWWILFPSDSVCTLKDAGTDFGQYILCSPKLPFSIFLIAVPLSVYLYRMLRSVYLSWLYSKS